MMVTLPYLVQVMVLLSLRETAAIQVQMTEPEVEMVNSQTTSCHVICIRKWRPVAYLEH